MNPTTVTVESRFFEPVWESKIGSRNRSEITAFDSVRRGKGFCNYQEVRKIEDSRSWDSIVFEIQNSLSQATICPQGLNSALASFSEHTRHSSI